MAEQKQSQVIDVDELMRREKEYALQKREAVERWVSMKQNQRDSDSTQGALDFDEILEDGTIRSGNKYTRLIEYEDINYRLAPEEQQFAIFDQWVNVLNMFNSQTYFQLLFYITKADEFEINNVRFFDNYDDEYQNIRDDYEGILKEQLSKGNNSMVKRKFISFTIRSNDSDEAKRRLERVENDLSSLLGIVGGGVPHQLLNFSEVVQLLHMVLNPDESPRPVDYQRIIESGLTSKDMVAPMSMNFSKNGNIFKLNNTENSIGYMEIIATEMSDQIMADLMDIIDINCFLSFGIKPTDQHEAIKFAKSKVSSVGAMKIEEQRKALTHGYDMDILPPDLQSNVIETQNFLDDLQNRNERMFYVTFTIMCTGQTPEELSTTIDKVRVVLQQYNVSYRTLNYQQEDALNTLLPFGHNKLQVDRVLTSTSTAIYVPFTTVELFQTSGEPLYYGLNSLSRNMIMADRKYLRNPNGLMLGTPGSGKSFGAKREIVNVFLATEDDIIITDPESEYGPLVNALGGQVIKLDQSSQHRINPLDINLSTSEEDDPISFKTDFILSFFEIIMGGKDTLTPSYKTIIQRSLRNVYQDYRINPIPENMPILEDLYDELVSQEKIDPETRDIRLALESYVGDSTLNFFNHQTNVDIKNRVVCFDIKDLGSSIKKLGMLIVQDQIWNRVSSNRSAGKSTRVYIDEFHLLLSEPQTANYSIEIWKRFRKWGGIPTGLTQNVKDLLSSPQIENIMDNTDFFLLFNQSAGDREILAQKLSLSTQQQAYLRNAEAGRGVIIYDNVKLPFIDRFPSDNSIYRLLTTKPGEVYKD